MFNRAILHLDMDAFFASVEVLRNSALKGKPLIVGGTNGRGIVASCSYEARAFGVRNAMPVRMALRLCPDAVVLSGDYEAYERYSSLVGEVIEEAAPAFEKAAIDAFYADLSGMDQYFGCWRWAGELRQRILRESGLPLSMSLASNKLVARIGTGQVKPNGACLVETGTERAFIAPLSVRRIPAIGDTTFRKLCLMGVRTVGTLQQIPPRLLECEFGPPGVELWKKANAEDDSPVVPYRDQHAISTERLFQTDSTDTGWLRRQLTGMVMQLGYELRHRRQLASCIAVKLRYADFNTFSRQQKIPHTASDQTLIRLAHELFETLYQRRQLIRLLGVRLSGLVHGYPQMSLFEDDTREFHLLQAMDRVRERFGKGAVGRGG